MHSSLEKILIAANTLPGDLRVIFDGYFMNDKSVETICAEQKITPEEFHDRHSRLLREIRAVH